MGKRRMVLRRPKQQAKLATEADTGEEIEVYVTDSGEMYTESGLLIGTLSDQPASIAEPAANTHTEPPQTEEVGAMSATATPILTFDDDFESTFISPARLAHAEDRDELDSTMLAPNASNDTTEACMLIGKSNASKKAIRRGIIMAASATALIAAAVTPSRAAQRSLFILGLLSLSAAHRVQPARVTINSALLSEAKREEGGHSSSTAIAVDTGASMHVSGRRELFPDHLISRRSPAVRVETANDVQCKVEFTGKMQLPVKYRSNIGASKALSGYLMLDNALYVPELKSNTLVSPRAMFNDQRIRTYFNDDKYVRMPDGKVIDMLETRTLYVMPSRRPPVR